MARRASNGMGTVFQRSDTLRWQGQVSFTRRDGTHARKTVYGKTENEVTQKMIELLYDAQHGKANTGPEQTLATYCESWLIKLEQANRSPRTVASYRQLLRLYILPKLAKVKLSKLTPEQIERFEIWLSGQKVARTGKLMSPRTVQMCHGLLRAALNRAVKLRLIHENPVLAVDPPSYRRPKVKPMSQEAARALLVAVRGTRLEALWTVAISCGLRPGEA